MEKVAMVVGAVGNRELEGSVFEEAEVAEVAAVLKGMEGVGLEGVHVHAAL